MKLTIFYSGIAIIVCGSVQFAYANSDATIIQECQKLSQYAQHGAQFYQQKNYGKALNAFKDQAAWTHFCSFHDEITHKNISSEQIATAYNNVGLTYAKLGKPHWARAWYEIIPESAKSQHNLKQLPLVKSSRTKTGVYVSYAGQGAWNIIEVKDKKDRDQITFSGLRMGLMGMIYGPNMGEFNIDMPKNTYTAQYRYEDCNIQLRFLPATAQGERIKVTQNQTDSTCGFGHGVYADGTYLKVEGLP